MQLSAWSMVLWISGFALNLLLFAILLYKKRYAALPWFTILIGQTVLQNVVLFSIHQFGWVQAYSYAYYAGDALDAILHLLVIWEVARILVERHLGLRLHDEIYSHWIGFVLMAVLAIYFVTYPMNVGRLSAAIVLRGGQILTIGVCGLLLMVLSLTLFFRVKVRVHAQAVVYGLALYSLAKFVMQGFVLLVGPGSIAQANDWLRPVYHLTLLLWIVCLWRQEPERALSDEMYTMVRQGRAGINPPIPDSVMAEQAQTSRRLVFSVREKKASRKRQEARNPLKGQDAPTANAENHAFGDA
jgi:hypothetical protein